MAQWRVPFLVVTVDGHVEGYGFEFRTLKATHCVEYRNMTALVNFCGSEMEYKYQRPLQINCGTLDDGLRASHAGFGVVRRVTLFGKIFSVSNAATLREPRWVLAG